MASSSNNSNNSDGFNNSNGHTAKKPKLNDEEISKMAIRSFSDMFKQSPHGSKSETISGPIYKSTGDSFTLFQR